MPKSKRDGSPKRSHDRKRSKKSSKKHHKKHEKHRKRESKPKTESKPVVVPKPATESKPDPPLAKYADRYVVRSVRNADSAGKPSVITPTAVGANSNRRLIFDGINCDLRCHGMEYAIEDINAEIFILTSVPEFPEYEVRCDLSGVGIMDDVNWQFMTEKELQKEKKRKEKKHKKKGKQNKTRKQLSSSSSSSSSESEESNSEGDSSDDAYESEGSSSEFVDETPSPEEFFRLLRRPTKKNPDTRKAVLEMEGWTFHLECTKMKIPPELRSSLNPAYYSKYNWNKVAILIRRIEIDLRRAGKDGDN